MIILLKRYPRFPCHLCVSLLSSFFFLCAHNSFFCYAMIILKIPVVILGFCFWGFTFFLFFFVVVVIVVALLGAGKRLDSKINEISGRLNFITCVYVCLFFSFAVF
jgi:hypothetical protein